MAVVVVWLVVALVVTSVVLVFGGLVVIIGRHLLDPDRSGQSAPRRAAERSSSRGLASDDAPGSEAMVETLPKVDPEGITGQTAGRPEKKSDEDQG